MAAAADECVAVPWSMPGDTQMKPLGSCVFIAVLPPLEILKCARPLPRMPKRATARGHRFFRGGGGRVVAAELTVRNIFGDMFIFGILDAAVDVD